MGVACRGAGGPGASGEADPVQLPQWPGPVHWQGWVLGKVVRVSLAAGFSHLVRYARGSALGVGDAASLLDTHSYGSGPAGRRRWVHPVPEPR
jgi:hypothetical protein